MESKRETVRRIAQTPGQLFVRESAPGEPESRKICGYAIVFNTPSVILYQSGKYQENEIIEPCAVTKEFLDSCDIKMTMFHDRQIVLARSNKGKGTLSYRIDKKGVYFEFEAPRTANGDEALELVKRGDLSGCSFIFTTYYDDEEFVKATESTVNGVTTVTYHVRKMLAIYDFTIAADPAYPDTSIEARERQQQHEARERADRDRAERAKVAKKLRELADDVLGENSEKAATAEVLRKLAKSAEY